MKIVSMTVDQMQNPIGYTFSDPCFSWISESDGTKQSAFHVQIRQQYSSELVYDSGVVSSDASNRVQLDLRLKPETRYLWRVRTWDNFGNDSGWSDEQYFETGKQNGVWQAKWISPVGEPDSHPYIRKSFNVKDTLLRARMYVCGLGLYEMYLNGEKVGDEVLTPGYNAYDQWIQVQTYDITELLHFGRNVIGSMLGNGWYKGRFALDGNPGDKGIYGDRFALLCEIHLEYFDGSREVLATDDSWTWQNGPVLDSTIYDGEYYDARKEIPGWSDPLKRISDWNPVEYIDLPYQSTVNRLSLPIRVTETIPVKEVITTPRGETVLDFGQNLAGWIEFKLNLDPDQTIELITGEVLDPMGNFYHENMRSAQTRIVYTGKGGPAEYHPRFTFFGFRYALVKGLTSVDPEAFHALVIHSDMKRIGHFTSNDPKLNKLYENTVWGQRGNFLDVPTDCPQRDERLGWTGDAQIFAPTASMHYDTDAFYTKFLHDLALEQQKNGWVPMYVPFCRNIMRDIAPCAGWSDAATIIPWTMYVQYGDLAILKKQYDSMKALVDYMDGESGPSHIYSGLQLGDWLAQDTSNPDSFYGATPLDLTATIYFAVSTKIVAKTAKLLKYEEDSNHYSELYHEIIDTIHREYVTQNGRIVSETQTALAMLVSFGILKKEFVPKAMNKLTEQLEVANYHLTTGFMGTPCLCPSLADNGYLSYAYDLLLKETYPSWLYEVNRGATTIWERWNSIREDGSLGAVNMNSFNHYAYGSISQFLYEHVAGIRADERYPGYKKIRFVPQPHSRLTSASASIDTPYGLCSSAWKLTDEGLMIHVKVPFNTSARIILPDSDGVSEIKSELGAKRVDHIGDAVYDLKAGEYTFRYHPNGKSIYQEVEQKVVRLI